MDAQGAIKIDSQACAYQLGLEWFQKGKLSFRIKRECDGMDPSRASLSQPTPRL
jgi:hypothetical protein